MLAQARLGQLEPGLLAAFERRQVGAWSGHAGGGVVEQRQRRVLERLDRPQGLAPVETQRAERVGLGQRHQRRPPHTRTPLQLLDRAIGLEPSAHDPDDLVLAQALDQAEAEPDRGLERPALQPRLERAVPLTVVDVDLAHLDPVVDGVAHELGRGVKAHGLGVEDGATEHVRVAVLEPGRDVDQECEARGVALREAVLAEALDLAEAALGEVPVVAARGHAFDHLALEGVDGADMAEGGHGPAQPVRLLGRELGGLDRDPHRLLLEQGHAFGLAEHALELVLRPVLRGRARVEDLLLALAAAQIGVHHVALDRPRPDDRHLDDEVVERLGLEARQHRHLCPALDLEHADRVRVAEHGVDQRVAIRDAVHVAAEIGAVVHPQEIEGAADARQHAECQEIDLEHPKRVEIVLVPLDHGAIRHGGVLDRHQLAQRAPRDHEAADMLAQVAWKADQLRCEIEGPAQGRIVGIEPGLFLQAFAAMAPHGPGQRFLHVGREAHDLGDLAQGAAGPVADDGGGECRVVAPVGPIDPLDHLLAPLVLEIDVDVGRLLALARDEALEQEVEPRRIDRGDPQDVADGRVGGAAAPLAEDAPLPRVADDVVDREEVGRVAKLLDQLELALDQLRHLLRHMIRIALLGPAPGAPGQLLVRRAAVVAVPDRVVVGELGELEPAPLQDLERALEGLRVVHEQPRHLAGRLQVPLGVGEQERCRVLDRAMLADAGQDVLQRPAVGVMVVNVIGGERLDPGGTGELGETGEPCHVVASVEMAQDEVEVMGPTPCQPAQELGEGLVQQLGRDQGENLPLLMSEQIVEVQDAPALGRPPLAEGEQRAQPRVGGPVGRPAQKRGAAGQVEPAADQEPNALGLRRLVRPYDAGQAVAVGDRDAGQAQLAGTRHQLLRVRGTAQEAEVGRGLELGVAHGVHGAAMARP